MSEYFFRRYRNGERMAEDVRITQAATLEEASLAASRIAAQYRDGTVLVSECEVDLRAELAAERENNKSLNKHLTRAQGNTQAMKAERDALRAKLDVACEALEPFVAAEVYCGSQNTDPDDEVVKWLFAIGHIRRARFVLKMIKGGGDE